MTTRTSALAPETWDIDLSHSDLGFSVRHLVISKVNGRFGRWTGSLVIDDERPENSKVDIRIEAASIDTHEPKRDAHLRSPDFFNVDKHPELKFKSTDVRANGEGYRVTGDLTLAGVTRPVVLEVEALGRNRDPWGGERAGFSAKASLDRRDFGLTWNQALETGGVLVGDRIDITIEVEAVKRVAKQAA